MLSTDDDTKTELGIVGSKLAWCSTIVNAWGSTRRVIVKTFANAGDAWSSGTTIRDYDLTGTVSTAGAVISNLGIAGNSRVRLAANLATANARIRISNTNQLRWVEGTYGLVGSGADFTRSASPTAFSGDAVSATIRPPQFLPSGTGPVAPAWTAETPKYVVFDAWVDGAFVNGEGNQNTEVEYDDRGLDVALQHPFLASQIGDVAWWRCSRPIKYGFGVAFPQLFRHHSGCTRSGARPYEAAWISARPINELAGDWDTFPAAGREDGTVVYDVKNPRHSTYFHAGRFRFLNDARAEVGRLEWPGGRPINDPSAPQDEYYDPTTGTAASTTTSGTTLIGSGPKWGDPGVVVEPHWNMYQPLLWENEPAAEMPEHFFHGMEADVLEPDHSKVNTSHQPLDALYSQYQQKGLHMPFSSDLYPKSYGSQARTEPIDIYCANPNGGSNPYWPWASGYKYYAGARQSHDVKPGPGGPRSTDRAAASMPVIWFLSDRNGVRPEGQVPLCDFAWEFCKGYANLARTAVLGSRMEAISKADSLAGRWRQLDGYYGSSSSHPKNFVIDIKATGQITKNHTAQANKRDATGRHPTGYQEPEGTHHGYSHAGQAVLAFKDIRFAVMQRHHWDSHWMSCLGGASPTTDPNVYFGHRIGAWRFGAHLWTWLCAGQHELLYSREQIEARMQIELETMDAALYQPAFVTNANTITAKSIKNLGAIHQVGSSRNVLVEMGGNKGHYINLMAYFAKTSGFWGAMKVRSSGCANGLYLIINFCAKGSIDWVNATDARWTGMIRPGETENSTDSEHNAGHMICTQDYASGYAITPADVPGSWAEAAARLADPGQSSFFKFRDGTFREWEWDPPQHCRAQWPSIHKAVFADEYPWPGIDAADAKFKAFYAEKTAFARTTETTPGMQMYRNNHYRNIAMGFVKPSPE